MRPVGALHAAQSPCAGVVVAAPLAVAPPRRGAALRVHCLPTPSPNPRPPRKTTTLFDSLTSGEFDTGKPYNEETIKDIVQERTGWLGAFAVGLIAAAFVVEHFEVLIADHVELSFFVPLVMGHGGNTGSQTVSSVIRALALREVRWRMGGPTIIKEAVAGGIMGGLLGSAVLALSMVWSELSTETGLAVALALPIVSLWANGLAAFITLLSSKLKLDPTLTSGPLVTTLVDSTGLVIYFSVSEAVMGPPLS